MSAGSRQPLQPKILLSMMDVLTSRTASNVPGTFLDSRMMELIYSDDTTDRNPCLHGAYFSEGRVKKHPMNN